MRCIKVEAMRAMETAEKKMQINDFEGARQDAMKANSLYPHLENLNQMLSICDVYCSAQIRNLVRMNDWYGVLQVEKWADELTIKKQYRQLALVLHPDKNRFPRVEGAFKLICEAYAVLSNPAERSLYDNKIKGLPKPTSENHPNHQSNGDYQFNEQHGAQNSNNSNVFGKKVGTDQANSESINVENAAENLKTKETVNANFSSSRGFRVGKPSDGDVVREESKNTRTKSRNGTRKRELESRYGADSDSDIEVVTEQKTLNFNPSSLHRKKVAVTANCDADRGESKNTRTIRWNKRRKLELESGDCSHTEKEDVTEQENLGDAYPKPEVARRSSRRRHHVFYKEPEEDDYARPLKRSHTTEEANGKEHKDAVDGKDSEHSFPTVPASSKSRNKSKESLKHKYEGCDKGQTRRVIHSRYGAPADIVEIETDSNSDLIVLKCSDPEFSDFNKLRDGSQFRANQLWACYDALDGMPRIYANVRKVRSSPFELDITWLEVVAIDDSWEKWVDEGLHVGCGSFKPGETDKLSGCLSISHQVHCEKGTKNGYFSIYPREGEVWALHKDWDISWSSNPKNVKKFRYEIVEVLSDFAAGAGIKVVHLDKITGFVSLFRRAVRSETSSFLIKPSELYKFFHYVPSFKMTGDERLGVPIGSFELNPSSLPIKPDDLYVPSKAKIVSRDEDHGIPSSLPRYGEGSGKDVAVSCDEDSGVPSPKPRCSEGKGKDVAVSSDEDSGVPSPNPRYGEGKGKDVAGTSDKDSGVPSPKPRCSEETGKDVAETRDEDSGVPSSKPRSGEGKGKDVAVTSDEDSGVPNPKPRCSEGMGKDVAGTSDEDYGVPSPKSRCSEETGKDVAETRDDDSGVPSSKPRSGEGKGKDIASGSTCNPDKIEDLKGGNEDASQDVNRLRKWVFRPGLLGSSYFSFGSVGLNFFLKKSR